MTGKILFLDTVHEVLQKNLEKDGYICEQDYTCSKQELEGKIHQYTGLVLRSRFILDRTLLIKAVNLKFIARSGSGMENIDVEFARSKNIHCFNSPEGNRDAVGEHAIGMLLALLNNIITGNRQVKQGIWLREENRGIELGNKTIGIIGYGNTGSAFAQKLSGFGCRILAYDKFKKDFGNSLVKETTLQNIFAEADILSLHIPLSEENLHFVNEAFLISFAKPIYLINTSRGEVLQTSALVNCLKSGKVLGACLDVLEYESKSFENLKAVQLPEDFNYLVESEKVILTPHVAGWTVESYRKLSEYLYEKISAVFHN